MISYELAKELKDAGFPQNPDNPQVHTAICGNFDNPDPECKSENRGVAPTLEELIEACGERFQRLTYWYAAEQDRQWMAEIWPLDSEITPQLEGSTPTEAVAMLYLALHGKARTPMEGQ